MFQITWSLATGCIVEALIFYRLIFINSTTFWVTRGYTVFYSDSLVQLIGACLNVALLWLESSQNKKMHIVNNVERYKALLMFAIVSLYMFFILLNFIFLEYWVWQGILMLYVVVSTVLFGVGGCQISKLLSRGVARAPAETDEEANTRFQGQKVVIGRIVSTAKLVCFISAFGLGSEMGTLVCKQRMLALPKFLLSAGLRLAMLCIKIMVTWYLKGNTSFLGIKCCTAQSLSFFSRRQRLRPAVQIACAPAPLSN